ncbi:MAG: bluetail domain-containing putative surface protein, partial [Myxococcota bacterium]
ADDLLVLGTSSIPLDQTFRLQSKPGASKTIYLDFDGHTTTGTVWNTSTMGSSFYSPAYDTDGNASVFGDAELNRIQLIWQRLVSDFAPFDVNVTTMAPPVDWLVNKSGTDADSNWGVRVVVTSYGPSSATAGGISALGSFTYAQDCPVFVYTKSAVVTADTVSHEVGHSLGLTHDGTTSGSTYYLGHGIGETGWSPLMGGSNGNLSTWDDGTYAGSNNTGGSGNAGRGADDLAVITGYNGFGYRADQAGNSLASAAQLSISAGLVAQFGTIETRLDTDWFSFQLTAAGDLDLTFDPYWFRAYVDDDGLWGGSSTAYVGLAGDPVSTTPYQEGAANMDLAVELYDGQGRLLASADDTGLGARLAAQGLSAGSYYLKLDGVGLGDPTASPPTGYSDYASIGNYWISGTITAASDPTPLPAISLSLAATAVLENGTEGLVYTFARSGLANEALSVNFTWSGTATNGVDYTGLSTQNIQTITFPAASSTAALVLQPQPDNTVEGDETVGLTILSAPTYSVSTAETVVGVILDDDSVPVVPTFTPFVDVLSGTPESDAFVLLSWSDALLGATPDRITNLQTASDFIDTPATRTTAAKVKQLGSVASLSVNNIGALLTNKNFPRNNVATFTCPGSTGTRTFAAINDGNAGFQASTDPVIEITGYSGALSGLKVY